MLLQCKKDHVSRHLHKENILPYVLYGFKLDIARYIQFGKIKLDDLTKAHLKSLLLPAQHLGSKVLILSIMINLQLWAVPKLLRHSVSLSLTPPKNQAPTSEPTLPAAAQPIYACMANLPSI